ncbi:MAG: hypothetical protein RL069_1164 [Planctomycetota bacterium]|jgi:CzcA family heavy metal efflux pump
MIRSLIVFSLRYPWVIVGCAIALAFAGIVQLNSANWDVFPEFAPPQITVQTEAPGLATEEVEQLITLPIEASMSGVSRLKSLRSSSIPGLSVVTAIFEHNADVVASRQLLSERLVEVRSHLPNNSGPPRMMPLTSSTSRLIMIGLSAEGETTPESLRTLADWTIRRRLQAVPGVAHIEVFGGERKQLQIQVQPDRLQKYNLTLNEILHASRLATGFGGAGFIETPNQRFPVRQRSKIEGVADLEATSVAIRDGISLPLGEVADVRVSKADAFGSAQINGHAGVLLVVHKQPEFNTLNVTASVQSALDELKMVLPKDTTLHPTLFLQSAFIERAISNLKKSLLIGCILVTAVLILFLMNLRVLVISLVAIPLSLLATVIVLLGFGVSLNAMTLGGMAIALGELVDDAIVDVENVLRRLGENRKLAHPKPLIEVVRDGSLEVRSAIVHASCIVMLVFLPVFFLDGLPGKLFGPLGLAYITAIGVSLIIALTLTPALCMLLLADRRQVESPTPWFLRHCNAAYRNLLKLCLRFPSLILSIASALLLAAIIAVPFLGGEFLPDFRESNFVLFMSGKPDASLAESQRAGALLAKEILKIDGVVSVAQQIGRADLSEDTWGTNISENWIRVDDDADYDQILNQIQNHLNQTPGFAFQIKQFLRERIDEVLSGSTADLLIRVVGPELDVLRTKTEEISQAISDIQGVEDLRVEQLVEVPQLEVLLTPQRTAEYGLSVGSVNQAVQTLLGGTLVGQIYNADSICDIVVRASPTLRDNPLSIGDIPIDTPLGHPIPLRSIATINMVAAPNMINRDQGRRRALVTCNARGKDTESVMKEIQDRVSKQVTFPNGYHVEFGGEYQAKLDSQKRIATFGILAILGIFMILYIDFKSIGLSLLVMISVPMAGIGGVLAILLNNGDISLGSLIGFITIFGIAVRNGILLISNFERLKKLECESDIILKGSIERLSPILMTAATTGLALLPLVVTGNLPGHEIEYPMAIVILGGLISSTLLTLFVLPVTYEKFFTKKLS